MFHNCWNKQSRSLSEGETDNVTMAWLWKVWGTSHQLHDWSGMSTSLAWLEKKDFFSRCSPRTTSTRATFLPLMQWRQPSLRRFKWSPRRNVQSTVASTERWTSGGRTPLDIFGLFETKWYPFTFLLLYHLWFLDLYPIISFQKLWNTLYKDGEGGQFMWVHCQSISPSPHPPKIKVMGNKGW